MNWISTVLQSFTKMFQWWVLLAPWEQGLRIRAGKMVKDLGPGIHFRIPFWDRIYVQSIRLRAVRDTNLTVTTKDGKNVVASIVVEFAIRNLRKLYDATSNPEIVIHSRAASAFVDYVSGVNEADIKLSDVELFVTDRLRELRQFGLAQIRMKLNSFAIVRTYRLITNDYRDGAGLWDFDREQSGLR